MKWEGTAGWVTYVPFTLLFISLFLFQFWVADWFWLGPRPSVPNPSCSSTLLLLNLNSEKKDRRWPFPTTLAATQLQNNEKVISRQSLIQQVIIPEAFRAYLVSIDSSAALLFLFFFLPRRLSFHGGAVSLFLLQFGKWKLAIKASICCVPTVRDGSVMKSGLSLASGAETQGFQLC